MDRHKEMKRFIFELCPKKGFNRTHFSMLVILLQHFSFGSFLILKYYLNYIIMFVKYREHTLKQR